METAVRPTEPSATIGLTIYVLFNTCLQRTIDSHSLCGGRSRDYAAAPMQAMLIIMSKPTELVLAVSDREHVHSDDAKPIGA